MIENFGYKNIVTIKDDKYFVKFNDEKEKMINVLKKHPEIILNLPENSYGFSDLQYYILCLMQLGKSEEMPDYSDFFNDKFLVCLNESYNKYVDIWKEVESTERKLKNFKKHLSHPFIQSMIEKSHKLFSRKKTGKKATEEFYKQLEMERFKEMESDEQVDYFNDMIDSVNISISREIAAFDDYNDLFGEYRKIMESYIAQFETKREKLV